MNRSDYIAAVKQRNESVLESVRSGASYATIGSQYGLTRARISQIAKSAGIHRKKKEV